MCNPPFPAAFKALVGSHNYNLNTETSDKDYKIFVLPTFDDLYHGKLAHTHYVSQTLDYTVHDIRQLPKLLWKANINFIEVLFSQETNTMKLKEPFCSLFLEIEDQADELSRMNLPRLYSSCLGMATKKYQEMHKDSPGRHASFSKSGYDTKSACHALRLLDFLSRLAGTHESFREALWYEDGSIFDTPDPMRQVLLDVKGGKYPLAEVELMFSDLEKRAHSLEGWYTKHSSNLQANEWLEKKIQTIVALGLYRQ